jgi:hypothetical protein
MGRGVSLIGEDIEVGFQKQIRLGWHGEFSSWSEDVLLKGLHAASLHPGKWNMNGASWVNEDTARAQKQPRPWHNGRIFGDSGKPRRPLLR